MQVITNYVGRHSSNIKRSFKLNNLHFNLAGSITLFNYSIYLKKQVRTNKCKKKSDFNIDFNYIIFNNDFNILK